MARRAANNLLLAVAAQRLPPTPHTNKEQGTPDARQGCYTELLVPCNLLLQLLRLLQLHAEASAP